MPDSTITTKVIVNLLLIALGYSIKKVGFISREEGQTLNRLVLYLTLPAMNLKVISGAELPWQLLILPVVFLGAGVGISQLGKFPARALKLSRPDTGTFVISLCGVMGSLAYPFVEAGYGDEGIRAVAICDLGNALAIFGMAYYTSFQYANEGDFSPRQIYKKVITFFPLHAFLAAIALNIANIELCGLPGEFVDALASINSPLMLLSLGIYLELDISWDESKILLTHLVYKYGLGLLVSLFCIFALPFTGAARAVTFLLPLMPTSLSTLLYSVEQELNPRLAAMIISLTMVVSLVITTVMVLGFREAF
ncbi:MAG: AEC family transporter [Anaerolineae bacterium]|nr:AEC family transporter [Anaerolineae bacterium]